MPLDFSEYDRRNYPMVGPREGYARWSVTYDGKMLAQLDLDLLERVADIDWAGASAAVDLACGTGRIGAWLRQRGVDHVDGVDLTEQMLEHARRKEIYRSLAIGDMRDTGLSAGAYEVVTNSLACEHIDDIVPLYAEAGRLSAPGGAFAVIAYHPVFMLRGIPTHFTDQDGNDTSISTTIHLVSDHVAAARETGWQLVEMHERLVDDDWVAQTPKYERHRGWPITLCAIWRRR